MGIASSLAFFAIYLCSKCSAKALPLFYYSIQTIVPNAHPNFNDKNPCKLGKIC